MSRRAISGAVVCSERPKPRSELLTTKLQEVQDRITELVALTVELSGLVERSKQLDPADQTAGQICHILHDD